MEKRKLEIADLFRLHYHSDPQISPDGKRVAYVETRLLQEENRYEAALRIWTAKAAEQVEGTAKHPRWAGEMLYYLRKAENGSWQVFRRHPDGAEQKLTDFPGGVSGFSVSPNGESVCFLARKRVGNRKPLEPIPVERLYIKEDGEKGLLDANFAFHYYLISRDGTAARQLTPDAFRLAAPMWGGLEAPVWSPGGDRLAFTGRVQDDELHDKQPWQSELYVADLTGSIKAVTGGCGVYTQPAWKDRDTLFCFAHHNEFFRSTDFSVFEISAKDGTERNLTAAHDLTIGNQCIGDCESGASNSSIVYDANQDALYFLESREGNANLLCFSLQTGELSLCGGGERVIGGFTLNAPRRQAAIVYSSPLEPSAIGLLRMDTGEETALTNENAALLRSVELSKPEKLRYTGARGVREDGWMMKPVGWQEGGQYPAVLEIHGGPYGLYGSLFFLEFQLLAAAGLGVVFCNPIGSKGYGQQFSYAVVGEYSKRDYDDLMCFTDACLEKFQWIDKARLGVTGGSYGGYMTNWIVTQTNRFAAAVAQRSISNWMTMFATSDSGYVSIEQMLLGRPMRRLEELLEISPIVYAERVETPLLLLHSECDMRCPIEQAEQFYVALKAMSKEVHFIRFPDSNHGLSRGGLPLLRAARLGAIMEFLDSRLNRTQAEKQEELKTC